MRPLMILNFVVLALMLFLIVQGTVSGWIFDLSSARAGNRALMEQLGLISIVLSVGVVWISLRPGASMAGRAAGRVMWWDRMFAAVRLVTTTENEHYRRTGLLLLEQLIDDPDATADDRKMLRGVVETLKNEVTDIARS